MKLSFQLLMVVALGLALSTEAVDINLRRRRRRNGSSNKQCGPVNSPLTPIPPEPGMDMDGSICQNNQIVEVDIAKTDTEECFDRYNGNGELECCCSPDNSKRTIEFNGNLNQFICPVSTINIEVTYTPCQSECCDSCKCVGDPHCTSFVNNQATPGTRVSSTILTCDVRDFPNSSNNGKCGNGKQNNKQNRKRCLAEGDQASKYYFNGPSRCQWLPDTNPDWNFKNYGAPCQPIPSEAFAVNMYADGSTYVNATMGERGVVDAALYKDMKSTNANSQLTLTAKTSCFEWTNSNGEIRTAGTGQSGSMTINGNKFDFVRVAGTDGTTEEDVWWTITGDTSTVVVQCYGATDDESSTRPEGRTRLDVEIFTQTPVTDSDEGFCPLGSYGDLLCEIFYRDCVDPFVGCKVGTNDLDEEDYEFLQSVPECQAQLAENGCGSYEDGKGSNSAQNTFEDIMSSCAVEYCQSFYNGEGDYLPPPGSTVAGCVSDFDDFGHSYVTSMYGNTFKKNEQNGECNTVTTKYMEQGSNSYNVIEDLTISGTLAVTKTISLNVSADTNGFMKPASEIKVIQEACPYQCESTGSVTAKVTYVTQCEELLYYAQNGFEIISPDGSVVETGKFGSYT